MGGQGGKMGTSNSVNHKKKVKLLDCGHSGRCEVGKGKQRKKINKWECITLKSFCTSRKQTINKIKREPTLWENIFANDTSDKELISKIYKDFTPTQLNTTQHQQGKQSN